MTESEKNQKKSNEGDVKKEEAKKVFSDNLVGGKMLSVKGSRDSIIENFHRRAGVRDRAFMLQQNMKYGQNIFNKVDVMNAPDDVLDDMINYLNDEMDRNKREIYENEAETQIHLQMRKDAARKRYQKKLDNNTEELKRIDELFRLQKKENTLNDELISSSILEMQDASRSTTRVKKIIHTSGTDPMKAKDSNMQGSLCKLNSKDKSEEETQSNVIISESAGNIMDNNPKLVNKVKDSKTNNVIKYVAESEQSCEQIRPSSTTVAVSELKNNTSTNPLYSKLFGSRSMISATMENGQVEDEQPVVRYNEEERNVKLRDLAEKTMMLDMSDKEQSKSTIGTLQLSIAAPQKKLDYDIPFYNKSSGFFHFHALMYRNYMATIGNIERLVMYIIMMAIFFFLFFDAKNGHNKHWRMVPYGPVLNRTELHFIKDPWKNIPDKKAIIVHAEGCAKKNKIYLKLKRAFKNKLAFPSQVIYMKSIYNSQEWMENKENTKRYFMGVSFFDLCNMNRGTKRYTLTMMPSVNNDTSENTDTLLETRIYPLYHPYQARYMSNGDIIDEVFFASMMIQIDHLLRTVLRDHTLDAYSTNITHTTFKSFPINETDRQPYNNQKGKYIFYILVITIFVAVMTSQDFIVDRENNMQDCLKILGVKNFIQACSIIIHYLLQLIIFAMIGFLILKIPQSSLHSDLMMVMVRSSYLIMFGFVVISCISFMMYAQLISYFFVSDRIMIIVYGIITSSLLYINYIIIQNARWMEFYGAHAMAVLFPLFSLPFGFSLMIELDSHGTPLDSHSIFTSRSNMDLNFHDLLICTLIKIVILIVLNIYMELISPSPYYIRKPYYFPFLLFKKKSQLPKSTYEKIASKYIQEFEETDLITIQFDNVSVAYPNSDVLAIDGLSLKIRKGEITVLLGQNGAGKSTIMSLICGTIDSHTGITSVNGKNLKLNKSLVKGKLGFCPQVDNHYEEFTVRQYTLLIKKIKPQKNDLHIMNALLEDSTLMDSMDCRIKNLSVENKRKLSIIQAIYSADQIVLFDEPSIGLDSDARIQMWQIIRKYTLGKTVVISTHDMDEAEYLADTIAILAGGKLCCYGTAGYLKNLYDCRYIIKFIPEDYCNVDHITKFLSNRIMGIKKPKDTELCISYKIPGDKFLYPGLLRSIEKNLTELQLRSFVIEKPSLSEVFNKAVQVSEENQMNNRADNDLVLINKMESKEYTKQSRLLNILTILLSKRVVYYRNDVIALLCMFLPTIVYACLLFVTTQFFIPHSRQEISLSMYRNVNLYFKGPSEKLPDLRAYVSKYSNVKVVHIPDTNVSITEFLKTKLTKNPARYHTRDLGVIEMKNATNILHFNTYMYHVKFVLTEILNNFENNIIIKPTKNNIETFSKQLYYLVIPVTLIYIFLFFGIYVINSVIFDKINQLHTLQIINGMGTWSYWFCNFCIDYMHVSVIVISTFFVNYVMGMDFMFRSFMHFMITLLLHIVYSLNLLTMMYQIIPLVSSIPSAYTYLQLRLIPEIAFISMLLYDDFLIDYVIIFVPSIGFVRILGKLLDMNCDNLSKCKELTDMENGIPKFFILLLINVCLGILVCILVFRKSFLIFFDSKKFKIPPPEIDNELNIKQDISDINLAGIEQDPVIAKKLYLQYKYPFSKNTSLILNGISFRVHKNKCFGLLGLCGSGKSSIFKILSGLVQPTSGEAHVLKLSVKKNINKIRPLLGYMMDIKSLIPFMTIEENLVYYGRCRGLSKKYSEYESDRLLIDFDMYKYRNLLPEYLSGGNERKLAMAIAMIGKSPIIFLDEPTIGLDPVSRRKAWQIIKQYKDDGNTVILSSQSMDECEQLCEKLMILVKGTMKCGGDLQYIKDKYGKHFTMVIEFNNGSEIVLDLLMYCVSQILPQSKLTIQQRNKLTYVIDNTTTCWSQLFEIGENLKNDEKLNIYDYSISQSNLEQIFINISEQSKVSEKIPKQIEEIIPQGIVPQGIVPQGIVPQGIVPQEIVTQENVHQEMMHQENIHQEIIHNKIVTKEKGPLSK